MAQATRTASRRKRGDDSNSGYDPRAPHRPSWYDWPYCLDRQPDGTWLALNRNYKPLGDRSGRWVEYETHPARQPLQGLTKALAFTFDFAPHFDKCGELVRVYLHDDATSPRRSPEHRAAYLEKLKVLLEVGLELPEPPRSKRALKMEADIRAAARKRPRRPRAWPIWKEVTK